MIYPTDSKLYMENDRFMLAWRGRSSQPPGVTQGTGPAGAASGDDLYECGGTVDLTAHIEGIIRHVLNSYFTGKMRP